MTQGAFTRAAARPAASSAARRRPQDVSLAPGTARTPEKFPVPEPSKHAEA